MFFFQDVQNDFDNFAKLFNRFLIKSGPSIDWSKIKSPPEGYVSDIF